MYHRLLLIPIGCVILTASECDPFRPDPTRDLTPPGGPGIASMSSFNAARYVDGNGNGVFDMPNTAAYVQGPIRVTVTARQLAQSFPTTWPYADANDAGFNNTAGPWRWTFREQTTGSVPQGIAALPIPVSGVSGLAATRDAAQVVTYSDHPVISIELFEGEWTVELARTNAAGAAIYWKTSDVSVNDVLVIQLGDSYSAGEGAPDRSASAGYWGDDGAGGNGTHPSAHRSSHTWGSVFAQQMEPVVQLFGGSVTYVNLAVSGALIDEVEAQLDQLAAIKGPRQVDMVLMSIGGNDAGFSSAVAAYLLREPIAGGLGLIGPNLSEIESAIETGDWTGGPFTDVGSVLVEMLDFALPHKFTNVRGLDGLAAGYQQLANQFTAQGIAAGNVYILKYPDPLVPFGGNPNEPCTGDILSAAASFLGRQLEIEPGEQRRVKSDLITPLNQQIGASAAAAGWRIVDASKAMYNHPICSDSRMVLRYQESQDVQGDHQGTLHPNRSGYARMAEDVWDALP